MALGWVPGIPPSQYPSYRTPGTPAPGAMAGVRGMLQWCAVRYPRVNIVVGLKSVAQVTSGPH